LAEVAQVQQAEVKMDVTSSEQKRMEVVKGNHRPTIPKDRQLGVCAVVAVDLTQAVRTSGQWEQEEAEADLVERKKVRLSDLLDVETRVVGAVLRL
jgi:hypothetical protein